MEYYTVKPPESSKVDEALRDFLDGALDPLLGTNQGSLPIKFLYKYFGPGSAANEINKVIIRQDGFYFLDGLKIIADSGPKAEIAAALTLALRGVALGILGGASLPIALEVAVAGAAAAGATWVYQAFVQPAVGRIFEIFGVASTRLEITNSSGQSVAGVVYRNGLAAEGKSSVDAALSLLNFSAGKFNVNSHVAVYINDNENTGYDVLAGNYLAQIAGAMGDATSKIANGTGVGVNGTPIKNSDLLTPYLSGADFTIMQTGAKLGLQMYSNANFGNGEAEYFLKKEISVGGDLSGLNLQAAKIAVFGTNGVDNLDLGAAAGKVYAYGGLGSDTIRGGRGADVLWGDSPVGSGNGEIDFIHGGAGNDEISGGGGGDQLFGDEGADYVDGGIGDDTIDGGSERDELWGGMGNDTIHGGEGADIIRGGSGTPGESDTDATNKLYGDGGNDEIYGAEGNDELYGGADDDKLSGGAGNDKLFGSTGKDRLTGGAGGDQFYVGSGDFVLDSDSADRLFVADPDGAIGDGAPEDETYYIQLTQPELTRVFLEYSDLNGNYLKGNNYFYVGQGGDIEFGDSRIFINTGRSLVILNRSEANPDYIIAKEYQAGDFGLDIFDPAKFATKAKQHYEANRSGSQHDRFILTPYLDFLKTALALEKQANEANREGRSDLLQVLDTPTQIAGTQDVDFLQGTAGEDEIVGGGEMDLLLGGAGSDIYRYAAGDGDDYIMDYDGDADDVDVLTFDDLNIGDIELSSSGGPDLFINVLGTQQSTITITNQFAQTGLEGVEEIHLADATVLNRAQIREALQTVRGTNGNDELHVKPQQINGEWQPTIFVGGRGNDHLYGGNNGDTYVYAKGDGNDTIQDFADGIGTLRLSDLNPDDISVSRLSDNSIVITIGDTGETITVKPYSNQTIGFDQVVFANGTIWDRDDILAATHAPTGATLTGDAVAENAVNGTVVGIVAGVDPDADAVLTYSLTNDAGGRFAIDATTGQITVANGALLDYESATPHSVVVRVTDQTGLTFDKSFTLNVTDVNEAPTGAALTGGSVAENAANGTVVGTVAGVDPDAGATLIYTLMDNAGGRFAIDANTGEIMVADGTLLDYETATSHDVTVRVTDQGGLTFDRSFTIAVTDVSESVNHAPTDATLAGGSVGENATNGTVVGTVAGVDPDAAATLTYALTDNAGGRFAIDTTTGVITVAAGALLNYEAAASHNVTVRVTDQGGLIFDKSFTLNVTNVNEAPTNATLTGGSVAENAADGTVVGTVAGVDPDAGATPTYALTDNADGRFAIDATTGQITVADGALLNYESVASHNVTVRVTDQGGLTFDKSFTLNVTNVNEAPTGATLTGGSVAENAANGAVVGTVAGFDPDAGTVLTYSLTDDAGGRFAIDATTGRITVADETLLDYETAASHAITVHVVDQGGLAFDKVFTIAVTDVNETVNNAPTDATLSGGSIAENASNGAVVGIVTGVDPDSGAVLTYSMTDSAGGRFAINAASGQITVANGGLLDYESATSHSVTVRITDQGGLTFDKVFALNVTNVGGGTQNGTSAANSLTGTAEEDVLNGLGGNDTLNGLGGNDTLDGGAGNDTMSGGAGDDVYIVDAAGDVVNENANEGADEVRTSLSSYTLGVNVENVTATTSTALTASGNALNNIIKGNSGNDVLFGEDGNDTLLGGAGDDVLQGGEGNDIFDGQGGQNWITTGNGQDTLIFNSASGYLQVDDFSDGNDKIDMRGTGITLQNAAQNITFTEYAEGGVLVEFGASQIWFENIMPGHFTFAGDFIFDTGDGANHAPTNATLSGGSTAENASNGTLVGTITGVDPDAGATFAYSLTDDAGGRFAINATTGQITVANGTLLDYETATSHSVTVRVTDQGGLSFDKVFTLGITDVSGVTQNGTSAANTLTGTNEGDTLNGLGGNDTLNGHGGNDVLDGGTGNDTMNGGIGNDIYIVDSSNDVVNENANEGVDEVRTSLSSYTLGANVENVTATTGTALTISGNGLDNIITGNSGDDVLFGGAGNDTLLGGAGDDVLQGEDGNDIFDGQGGTNWITTGAGQDTLIFNFSSGNLQVDDFSDGNDKIDMRGTGITAANAAQNITITEYAEGGVLVEFGSSQIWLEGIMPGTITVANDFILN